VAFESREERVIGTYLSPPRLFGEDLLTRKGEEPRFAPQEATEVVRTIPVRADHQADEHLVHVTRIGGLFVRPPDRFSLTMEEQTDRADKIEFERQVAASLNALLCEMALNGVWSEPVSPIHLGGGILRNGRVSGTELVFHPETGGWERTQVPNVLMQYNPMPWWFMWNARRKPEGVLDEAAPLTATKCLIDLSPTLPIFVVSAFASFVRRLAAESIINSWIVVEQVIHSFWTRQVTSKGVNRANRDALDRADFTASMRHNVLTAALRGRARLTWVSRAFRRPPRLPLAFVG
jgi:hypothetical protein